MDTLTQTNAIQKKERSKKMMLYFGIISLIMSFAGWTSAFIVSSARPDWLNDFKLPNAFFISVVVILLSSVTFYLAKRAIKNNKFSIATGFLFATLVLALFFIYNQFSGFGQIISQGYHFTGPTSNITMSYIYLIAVMHILHVVAGVICLLVVIYNHFKQRYSATNLLGVDLALTFWHFVDILWLYLFLFLYFVC